MNWLFGGGGGGGGSGDGGPTAPMPEEDRLSSPALRTSSGIQLAPVVVSSTPRRSAWQPYSQKQAAALDAMISGGGGWFAGGDPPTGNDTDDEFGLLDRDLGPLAPPQVSVISVRPPPRTQGLLLIRDPETVRLRDLRLGASSCLGVIPLDSLLFLTLSNGHTVRLEFPPSLPVHDRGEDGSINDSSLVSVEHSTSNSLSPLPGGQPLSYSRQLIPEGDAEIRVDQHWTMHYRWEAVPRPILPSRDDLDPSTHAWCWSLFAIVFPIIFLCLAVYCVYKLGLFGSETVEDLSLELNTFTQFDLPFTLILGFVLVLKMLWDRVRHEWEVCGAQCCCGVFSYMRLQWSRRRHKRLVSQRHRQRHPRRRLRDDVLESGNSGAVPGRPGLEFGSDEDEDEDGWSSGPSRRHRQAQQQQQISVLEAIEKERSRALVKNIQQVDWYFEVTEWSDELVTGLAAEVQRHTNEEMQRHTNPEYPVYLGPGGRPVTLGGRSQVLSTSLSQFEVPRAVPRNSAVQPAIRAAPGLATSQPAAPRHIPPPQLEWRSMVDDAALLTQLPADHRHPGSLGSGLGDPLQEDERKQPPPIVASAAVSASSEAPLSPVAQPQVPVRWNPADGPQAFPGCGENFEYPAPPVGIEDYRTTPWGQWGWADYRPIKVRGPNYLVDKAKVPTPAPVYQLVWVDFIAMPDGSMRNFASHPRSYAQNRPWPDPEGNPEDPLLVLTWVMPGNPPHNIGMYFRRRRRTGVAGVTEDGAPVAPLERDELANDTVDRLLHRFMTSPDDNLRDSTLKFIPSVVDGSWIVRKTTGSRPAIIGKKLKQYYFREHINDPVRPYFEVAIDVGSSRIGGKIMGVCLGFSKSLSIDLHFVIQGESADELPEHLLGGLRLHYCDTSFCPPWLAPEKEAPALEAQRVARDHKAAPAAAEPIVAAVAANHQQQQIPIAVRRK